MGYLLDANIIVAALNGQLTVVERLNLIQPGQALLPAMALAELRYGALSSRRVEENLARIVRPSPSFAGGERASRTRPCVRASGQRWGFMRNCFLTA